MEVNEIHSNQPIVAVITRTKDRPLLLRRAVKSVLSQDYPHWVHVVVNDGGEVKAVEEVLFPFLEKYNGRLKLIHNAKSVGMEAASNLGIRSCNSDFIVIHDDDDSWSPKFLSRAIEEFFLWSRDFSSIQGVITYCNRIIERIEGNTIVTVGMDAFNHWLPTGLLSFDTVIHANPFPPICFLFTRYAYNVCGPFREDLPVLGDWEFNIRFLSLFDIIVYPHTLAFYHHRPTAVGAMGNSVISGVDRHHQYRQLLLNEWLRKDVGQGLRGLGVYANMRQQIESLRGSTWRNQNMDLEMRLPFTIQDVDTYWNSTSWRLTRPLRNFVSRLKGLPGEVKPRPMNDFEATIIVLGILHSSSWDITGPFRVMTRMFRRMFIGSSR